MPAYHMTVTMLAPVHVGSGEEIEPTAYVVRRVGEGDEANFLLHAVNVPAFLTRLSDAHRGEFNTLAERGNVRDLRRFVDRTVDLRRDVLWSAPCNSALFDLYRAGLNDDRAQLRVVLMTRDPRTGMVYLPGSSLKGALRTAWLNRQAAAYAGRAELERIGERDFEPEVLGYRTTTAQGRPRAEIRADPFRAISVGDAPLCADSNCIEPCVIHKPMGAGRVTADPAGIQMFYDVTFSGLDHEAITARGRLVINHRLARADTRGLPGWNFPHSVSQAIGVEDLLAACNAFYRSRLEDEVRRFPRLAGPGRTLLEQTAGLGPHEALLRLGRFSHVECMTVDRRGGEPFRKGTTRTLVNGELPLGWVKLTLSPVD